MKRHTNLLCLGAAVALLNACAPVVNAPEPVLPVPEKKQVDWQKMETYAFVHFGLNTFNDREWGYGDSDPATFNPVKLDCEQWVKTFVAAGMKGVILTAKHHDGFCLWPTGLTEYCIRNTPYKDGKGDIVRDLSEACKKYGIKFAVYLSPWDRHQAAECDVSIRPGWFYHPEEDDRVKTVEQLTDLYYRSVGHNATLLLNFPVNRDGLIHPVDSANAVDFYKNVQKQLANNLLKGVLPIVSNERGGKYTAKAVTDGEYDTYWATEDSVTSAVIEFEWPAPQKVNRMLLQEYIPLGQRVQSFVVEYNKEGEWLPVKLNEETTTIGYKRLLRFETVTTDKLRINFMESRACLCINNIEAYYAGETPDVFTAKAEELKTYPFTLPQVDEAEAGKCADKDAATTCFVDGNTLLIDLGTEQTVSSFHYLPDQSEYNKGLIAAYEISVGTEANAVNQVVSSGEFSNIKNNPILQSVYFTPVTARYVLLKAVRMVENESPMGFAELGIR